MAKEYVVFTQIHTTSIDLTNQPLEVMRIWFRIPETNTQDYVDVPMSEYDAQNVDRVITERVNKTLELFRGEE